MKLCIDCKWSADGFDKDLRRCLHSVTKTEPSPVHGGIEYKYGPDAMPRDWIPFCSNLRNDICGFCKLEGIYWEAKNA